MSRESDVPAVIGLREIVDDHPVVFHRVHIGNRAVEVRRIWVHDPIPAQVSKCSWNHTYGHDFICIGRATGVAAAPRLFQRSRSKNIEVVVTGSVFFGAGNTRVSLFRLEEKTMAVEFFRNGMQIIPKVLVTGNMPYTGPRLLDKNALPPLYTGDH